MMELPPFTGKILLDDLVVGTGFVVREDGLIATCYHVLSAASPDIHNNQYYFQFLDDDQLWSLSIHAFDIEYDLAILRFNSLPKGLQIARLISGKPKPGTRFFLTAYGLLDDPKGHKYDYLSAVGVCEGLMKRNKLELIQLSSKNLLRGMSGAPVMAEEQDGVIGVLSGRYSIDPAGEMWFRDSGWAIPTARLEELINLKRIDFNRPTATFLSYSRRDESVVRQLYDDLQLRSVKSIWIDRQNLVPGDDWRGRITDAIINECSSIVVCVSPTALASTEVKYEYELAAEHGKKMIPLILHTSTYEDLPPLLRSLDALNIDQNGYENTIVKLANLLPRKHFVLPTMLPVKAGRFTMGNGHDECEVDLPDFWIGKTSVTVTEYAHFIEAGGYKSDKYWLPGTYQKWLHGPRERFWPDSDLIAYALKHPKQPMRGITWYEAVAYCNWLSYLTDHPFMLASEAEWEKAARGSDKRKWAFGNEWVEKGADIKEIGATTRQMPEDCGIKDSESPYGCQDMVGHVRNWTLSIEFDHPDHPNADSLNAKDLDEPRIIKGGSWLRDRSRATTYHREGVYPIPQEYQAEIGFRLVSKRDPYR